MLIYVPPMVTILVAFGAVGMAVPLLCRPRVVADRDALFVKTGLGRTLALPWSSIVEVMVVYVRHDRYLLLRRIDDVSDGPGWLERMPLRDLARRQPAQDWTRYDLAVPLEDFVGGIHAQLTALAAFAPDTVAFDSGEPS